jgi:hypothetical protein
VACDAARLQIGANRAPRFSPQKDRAVDSSASSVARTSLGDQRPQPCWGEPRRNSFHDVTAIMLASGRPRGLRLSRRRASELRRDRSRYAKCQTERFGTGCLTNQ